MASHGRGPLRACRLSCYATPTTPSPQFDVSHLNIQNNKLPRSLLLLHNTVSTIYYATVQHVGQLHAHAGKHAEAIEPVSTRS